jgi:hypothetical protein
MQHFMREKSNLIIAYMSAFGNKLGVRGRSLLLGYDRVVHETWRALNQILDGGRFFWREELVKHEKPNKVSNAFCGCVQNNIKMRFHKEI